MGLVKDVKKTKCVLFLCSIGKKESSDTKCAMQPEDIQAKYKQQMLNSDINLIYAIIFQTWRISERPYTCRGFIKLIFVLLLLFFLLVMLR